MLSYEGNCSILAQILFVSLLYVTLDKGKCKYLIAEVWCSTRICFRPSAVFYTYATSRYPLFLNMALAFTALSTTHSCMLQ